MPGSRLVAWRRTSADAGSVAAVLVTVLVVVALVAGVVATLPTLEREALRRAVGLLPANEAVVTVVGSYDADGAREKDRAVRDALEPLLDASPEDGVVVRQVRTVAHGEPGGARAWSFTTVEGAEEAVTAVRGTLPAAGAEPLQVAAPAGSSLVPGTRTALRSPLDGRRVEVAVVGTWTPGRVPTRAATDRRGLLLAPGDLDRVAGRGTSEQWLAAPDPATFEPAGLDDLITAAAGVETSVAAAAESTGSTLRVENGLVGALEARDRELLALRMLLLVPALLLLLLGAAAGGLVAASLAQNRRDDEWLMRSRGAGRWQLVGPTLVEALVVCLLGAAAGPLVATAVVRIGGVRPALDPTAWGAGLAAAAVCWVALVLPSVVGALAGDRGEQVSVERRRRRTLTVLVTAGLLVVALGVLATGRLRGFSEAVAAGGSRDVDPLLVAAPALLVLATASVLVLALVPLVLRLVERSVRTRGLALAVGTRSAARAPARAVPLALVVALVAGGVAFASVGRASQEAAREARAAYDVGSDVRVTAPPSHRRADVAAERAGLAALPGVVDVGGVDREREYLDGVAAEVLVADLSGRVAEDLLAFAPDPRVTRERLAGEPDGGTTDVVPVAVTRGLADRAALDVGRTLELALAGRQVTLEVVDVVPALPTVGEGREGMLVDRARAGARTVAPDEWWLAVDGRPEAVARSLADRPELAAAVTTRSAALARLADDPGTGGAALADVMTVTASGASLVGAVLLVSVVVLRRRDRDAQAAALRALGAPERDVTSAVVVEYTLVTGGGLLAGAVAGTLTAAIALDATALGAGGARLVPAPQLHVPWAATAGLLALLLAVPTLALLASTWAARRAGDDRRARTHLAASSGPAGGHP